MKITARILLLSACTLGLLASAQAAVETYKIDPVHSSVGFTIRHFFSNVPGAFTKFSGTIVVDRDNLENSSVEATIEVPSIDTRSEMRDKDLRSENSSRRRSSRPSRSRANRGRRPARTPLTSRATSRSRG